MYPDRDTLNNVSRSGYITSRDQSMVESGVTEGGKNTARSASYPDVSLDVRAKEGGKETTGVCTLPMIPCGSSPVTRFALASAMRKTKRLRRRLPPGPASFLFRE